MDDYKNITNKTINKLIDLSTYSSISWKTLDYMVRSVVHNLRLYCSFTDDRTESINMFRGVTLSKLNDLILIRNTKLVSLQLSKEMISEIENCKKHGPLGIVLYLSPIKISKSPASSKTSFCMYCKRIVKPADLILTDEYDVFAPWTCPKCKSHYMVTLDICSPRLVR